MYLRDELVESGSKPLDYQRAPPLNLSYAHSPTLLVELPRPNESELPLTSSGTRQAAAANSQFHVVRRADVSADHIILGVLSRGEIVDGKFRQLEYWLSGRNAFPLIVVL